MEEAKQQEAKQQEAKQQEAKTEEQRLVDIEVKDENTSLNMLVAFVHLAQKRGIYSLEESAKIWECIKVFQKSNNPV